MYPVNEQLGEHADIDMDSDLSNDSDDDDESIYMTEEEEGMDVTSKSDSGEDDDAEDEEQKSVPRYIQYILLDNSLTLCVGEYMCRGMAKHLQR